MTDEAFERALIATLEARAGVAAAPASLRQAVSQVTRDRAPARPPRWERLHGIAAAAAGLATLGVIVGIVGVILVFAGRGPAGGGLGGGGGAGRPLVEWDSGLVDLQADSLTIEAGGRGFPAQTGNGVSVHSDPGTPTYRTLEVEWNASGTPMRLYLYFDADKTDWWVSELRTYNGTPQGDWITYHGPLFKTPVGETYVGDVDLSASERGIGGRLLIKGLHLSAFAPGTASKAFIGCRPAVTPAPDGQEPHPLAAGQPLAGTGIENMTPQQAEGLLSAKGFCHTYRYSYSTGPNTGYSEIWCDPPPGRVMAVFYGTSGEVVLMVQDTTGMTTPRPQPPNGWGC